MVKQGLVLDKVEKGSTNILSYARENGIAHVYVLTDLKTYYGKKPIYRKYTLNKFIQKYGLYIDITEAKKCLVITENSLNKIRSRFIKRIAKRLSYQEAIKETVRINETKKEIEALKEETSTDFFMLNTNFRVGVKISNEDFLWRVFRNPYYEVDIMLLANHDVA